MNGFIEFVGSDKKRRLVNTRHIEAIVERGELSCYIYLTHNCPSVREQDYFVVSEPYEVIKMLIEKEGAE